MKYREIIENSACDFPLVNKGEPLQRHFQGLKTKEKLII